MAEIRVREWRTPLPERETSVFDRGLRSAAPGIVAATLIGVFGFALWTAFSVQGRPEELLPTARDVAISITAEQGWTVVGIAAALLALPLAGLGIVFGQPPTAAARIRGEAVLGVADTAAMASGIVAWIAAIFAAVATVGTNASALGDRSGAPAAMTETAGAMLVLVAALLVGLVSVGLMGVIEGAFPSDDEALRRRLVEFAAAQQRAADQVRRTAPLLERSTSPGLKRRAFARSAILVVSVSTVGSIALLLSGMRPIGILVVLGLVAFYSAAVSCTARGVWGAFYVGPKRGWEGKPARVVVHDRQFRLLLGLRIVGAGLLVLLPPALAVLYCVLHSDLLASVLTVLASVAIVVVEMKPTPWSWQTLSARSQNETARRTLTSLSRQRSELLRDAQPTQRRSRKRL